MTDDSVLCAQIEQKQSMQHSLLARYLSARQMRTLSNSLFDVFAKFIK